jgi:hypothetical protein
MGQGRKSQLERVMLVSDPLAFRSAVSFALACVLLAGSAPAQAPTPLLLNDEARLLAGLPVSPGSALAALEASRIGRDHAAAVEREWASLESIRLRAMDEWAATELNVRISPTLPLIYLFGGPDFISADALYPSASSYVLGGLEPIGEVPSLAAMKPETVAAGLQNLRDELKTMLRLSHFITDEMATELRRTGVKGVLPLLYLFVARTGGELLATDLVFIDRSGRIVVSPSGVTPEDGVPGARLSFRTPPDGKPRLLYYFRMDLANTDVPAKPGFFPFLQSLGPANSYLKAASFILHNSAFSITRDYLLTHSRSILQDDSGIPFRAFKHDRWNFVFFGTYVAPVTIFKGSFQADLDKAFRDAAPTRPLPFSAGYAHSRKSGLLLAVAK